MARLINEIVKGFKEWALSIACDRERAFTRPSFKPIRLVNEERPFLQKLDQLLTRILTLNVKRNYIFAAFAPCSLLPVPNSQLMEGEKFYLDSINRFLAPIKYYALTPKLHPSTNGVLIQFLFVPLSSYFY